MENLNKLDDKWASLQIKVFSRWCTNALRPAHIVVRDVTKDLRDGTAVVQLAEILTRKSAPRRWDRQPKFDVQKVQNCDLALEMFKADGIKFVSISGKDISDGTNPSLTLGFIWTLILNYAITFSLQTRSVSTLPLERPKQENPTQALMQWCKDEVQKYEGLGDFKQVNFSMAALINNYRPDLIQFDTLDKSNDQKCAEVVVSAFEKLHIPILLDAEDIAKGVDDKTLYTQLALVKRELDHIKLVQERGVSINLGVSQQRGNYPTSERNFMLHGKLRVYKNWENNSKYRLTRKRMNNAEYY